jgi:four helix bundle protein
MEKSTAIRSFRDLRVWQAGMDLVEQVYLLTQTFPKHEIYGLASQMQRSAVSVPSNIAEGHTREHLKEYLQHLSIARSSLAELETQLEIAARLKYCSPERLNQLLEQLDLLGRQLSTLRNALAKTSRPSTQPLAPSP